MKRYIFTISLILISDIFLVTACSNNNSEPKRISNEIRFNLIFKYGVGAKNELNTFAATYTKDMIIDPPITTNIYLSKEEMDTILNKITEINFFDYPDKFTTSIPAGEGLGMVTPYSSYYFKVEYGSKFKELLWEDNITNKDEKADKMRELVKVIKDIVEYKKEYRKLPAPRGGYD